MRRTLYKAVAVILSLSLLGAGLSGCAELGIKNETGGAIAGGTAGGLLGYAIGTATGGKLLLTIGGTLLGAYLGSQYGKKLDQKDRVAMATATEETLEKSPSGKATEWKNPDTGNRGAVVAKPAFTNAKGEPCREFTQTFTVEGKTETIHGTACRQSDGTWRVVN